MKQTLFMILVTLAGTFGLMFRGIYGVVVYYLFAVLRPQYIWAWALPPAISWSEIVAIPTICVAVLAILFRAKPEDQTVGQGRRFGASHLTVLLFGVWVTLSFLAAQDKDVAWPWFLEYLKIFSMFFVAALLIRSTDDVWLLMITAAAALGYISFEVNSMYLSSGYMGIYHNGYGGLDNNGAGLMLAMGVPLCLFLWMSTDRWWRWVFAALIPFILHAVLLTFSRGAMVALIAAAPLLFFRGKQRRQLVLAGIAMLALVPVLAGREIRQEFFSLQSYQEDGSAQSRFASWTAAYDLAWDYPIFGVGVRNSNLFLHRYGADMEGRTVHNQYLQIMADSGIPAMALYVVTLVVVAGALRRVRRLTRSRADQEGQRAYAIACGVEGALAVFCIGGLFLSLEVFELPYLLLLLGAQLTLVVRAEVGAVAVAMPRVDARTLMLPAPRTARTGVRA